MAGKPIDIKVIDRCNYGQRYIFLKQKPNAFHDMVERSRVVSYGIMSMFKPIQAHTYSCYPCFFYPGYGIIIQGYAICKDLGCYSQIPQILAISAQSGRNKGSPPVKSTSLTRRWGNWSHIFSDSSVVNSFFLGRPADEAQCLHRKLHANVSSHPMINGNPSKVKSQPPRKINR